MTRSCTNSLEDRLLGGLLRDLIGKGARDHHDSFGITYHDVARIDRDAAAADRHLSVCRMVAHEVERRFTHVDQDGLDAVTTVSRNGDRRSAEHSALPKPSLASRELRSAIEVPRPEAERRANRARAHLLEEEGRVRDQSEPGKVLSPRGRGPFLTRMSGTRKITPGRRRSMLRAGRCESS